MSPYNSIWLLAVLLQASSCQEEGYRRGDCQPGYLEVEGICTLAVGQPCTKNSQCLANECVRPAEGEGFCSIPCKAHEDCPAGFFCNLWSDERCHPGKRPPPCQEDADCGPCKRCDEGFCRDIPGCFTCLTDRDCAPCQRCDQEVCIAVAGCTPCDTDDDCAACENCGDRGECRREIGCILCGTDWECPPCLHCLRGACRSIPGCGSDPCFNDWDCPIKTRCLHDASRGHPTCLPVSLAFGADCSRGGGGQCAEEICVDNGNATATCSRSCMDNGDCPAPSRCLPDDSCLLACRQAESPTPGAACLHDADCDDEGVCSLFPDANYTAWSTRCAPPWPCAGANGQPCDRAAGDRCRSGICTAEGYCSSVCAADHDCPEGFCCVQLLLPLPGGGAPAPFSGCTPADTAPGEVGKP